LFVAMTDNDVTIIFQQFEDQFHIFTVNGFTFQLLMVDDELDVYYYRVSCDDPRYIWNRFF
jgi:hypothetical protein